MVLMNKNLHRSIMSHLSDEYAEKLHNQKVAQGLTTAAFDFELK